VYGECVPQMPHAAFSTECRGQENAEWRRLNGFPGLIADRGLGII
jgi:hypothetical protein